MISYNKSFGFTIFLFYILTTANNILCQQQQQHGDLETTTLGADTQTWSSAEDQSRAPATRPSIDGYDNSHSDIPYCIPTPQKLDFCSSSLGWAPNMRLPNLVGHKSALDLNQVLASYPIEELANVQCKTSEQLKLLVCSTMAPICLDLINLPCRHLCMMAKSGCRLALQRFGLEWPKFLDCRRFPRGPENCIGRQPTIVTGELLTFANHSHTTPGLVSPNSTLSTKRRRKEKKHRKLPIIKSSTATTMAPDRADQNAMTLTTTEVPPSQQTMSTSFPTTSQQSPVETEVGPLNLTTPPMSSNSEPTKWAPTPAVSTAQPPKASTATDTTSSTVKSDQPDSVATSPTRKQTTTELVTVTELAHVDYSSMPISQTDDLTQLLCSRSPDWLIKTRLTDNQLLSAVKRRKLKIRNYRQIFGPLTGVNSYRDVNMTNPTITPAPMTTINSTSSQANNTISRQVRAGSAGRPSSPASFYVSLADSTVFVTAMGSTLYTQPLTNALAKAGEFQDSPGRNYLISGFNNENSTTKLSSIFVVLPNSRISSSDIDSRGSFNILKTYREFKLRGSNVCQPHQKSTGNDGGPQNSNNMTATSTVDQQTTTGKTTTSSSGRTRKHKKKPSN